MTLPVPPTPEGASWFERHVIHRLDTLAEQVGVIDTKLDDVRQTVPRLEERVRLTAVLFGVLGGFLPAVAVLIYFAIKGGP